MQRQFERRVGKFRRRAQPTDVVTSELRQSLQNLADCINQTVKLLDRSEDRFAERDEEGSDLQRTERPRARGPLIPNRRSQLLAKIDMRPPFRQQGS
jgi:hypothetical protein